MKKITSTKVARNYVLAQKLKKQYNQINSLNDYKRIYEEMQKEVFAYSDQRLWSLITHPPRKRRFKQLQWYEGKVSLDKIGLWPHMSNIADNLLIKDAQWSVNQIYSSSGKLLKGQLHHLFRILPFVQFLNLNMPIIVVKGGTIRKKPYLEEKYDIEDGCHRAVCMGLLGRKITNAYIGIEKEL
ncbi:MAG: hypothetical protein KAS15_09030 [Nanoarchaeota archaeon]|nr:hypothetical protein [Nanoarchaeota archaeon]MCK5629319.1 hypothetical protein [Nanoarchaeota archaeon]